MGVVVTPTEAVPSAATDTGCTDVVETAGVNEIGVPVEAEKATDCVADEGATLERGCVTSRSSKNEEISFF